MNDSLNFLVELEKGTPAGADIGRWIAKLKQGSAKFSQIAANSAVFPPLFVWVVDQAKEDLEGGFRQVAEIYYARAVYRIEMLLYAALPVSVLLLGLLIVAQMAPMMHVVIRLIDSLGDAGGGE